MRTYECTKEEFLESVVDHKMKIVMADGVNRHIQFKKPYSRNHWFDIVTYKGALVIDGDMGTYVFRRLDDMFDFFRESPEDRASLKINPEYWAEKIFATSRYEGGHEHFSPALFRDAVRLEFDQWAEAENPSEEEKEELWGELLSEVINSGALDTKGAIEAAHRFRPSDKNISFRMRDFHEYGLKDFTYRFIWNCRAIVWAIKQYDHAKAALATADSEKKSEIFRRIFG
jgi:hypothetical protein